MRQIDFQELSDFTTSARGQIDTIYLHWTGGRYNQAFNSYHINIDNNGELWTDMSSLLERKSHTWLRNSRAIGIALDCCYDASIDTNGNISYGDYPPTEAQIDTMAKVVAKLCIEIGLPINYSTVMTHAECASIDGYGVGSGDPDMRWDLYGLGDELRNRAVGYANEWGY